MREIALFVEDYAHRQVIEAMVLRLAKDAGIQIRLDWRNVRRGHGAVVRELQEYLQDLKRQKVNLPDLLIVATDANCKGLNKRSRELMKANPPVHTVLAIPNPHIERWLLLDSNAFKSVFGRGCDAPNQKCARDRYKQRLIRAIQETGINPSLGGIEFAADIVQNMDIDRAAFSDDSLGRFVGQLKAAFESWRA